jgi:hypothetical protein
MTNLAHHQSLGPQLALHGCCDQSRDFFFLPSPFSQRKISKKTFIPRVILLGWGEADDSHSIASAGRHRSDRDADI